MGGSAAIAEALKYNDSITHLDLEENGMSTFTKLAIDRRVRANQRRTQYVARLLNDTQPPTSVKVHLCGDGGAGKTSLSSALRRSALGAIFNRQKEKQRDRGVEDRSARTRGVEVKYDTFMGCSFSFWDYGGQPAFHIGHHDHMRGAIAGDDSAGGAPSTALTSTRSAKAALRGVAVFLIVINLADTEGHAKWVRDLLYWRRFIRACLPAEAEPLLALVGSRADGRPNAQARLDELRRHANNEGALLPKVAAVFALDCRSHAASAPLRQWLVARHRELMQVAPPVPRACEAILARKRQWRNGKEKIMVLRWDDFTRRCRTEIDWLANADDELLRVAASFLHDSGDLIALDHGAASHCVVLHPTWLCSLVIGELIAPEELHDNPQLRRSLLSTSELEQATSCLEHFGERAGEQLGELLCELGLCFRFGGANDKPPALAAAAAATASVGLVGPSTAVDVSSGTADDQDVRFFIPALLEATVRPDRLLLDKDSAPHRLGRRLLSRTPDELLVPGFIARLQVRAAEQPSFHATSDFQERLWKDGLLLQHAAAQVLIERPRGVLPGGGGGGGSGMSGADTDRDRDRGLDVIVCGADEADVWNGLVDAQALIDAVLDECCPGIKLEPWLVGGSGLHPATAAGAPLPCVKLADAEAAKRRGETKMTFGGAVHDIAMLRGEPMRRAAESGLGARLRRAAAEERGNAVGGAEACGKWLGEVTDLHMGAPKEAVLGLERLLKLDPIDKIHSLLSADGGAIGAIEREVTANGTD